MKRVLIYLMFLGLLFWHVSCLEKEDQIQNEKARKEFIDNLKRRNLEDKKQFKGIK